ncbi:hypothetical protein Tco_0545464 [Tanacetum coccineum]
MRVHEVIPVNHKESKSGPGSPTFFGNLLRMTAEQFSFKGVLANSLNFSLFPTKVFKVEANLGMSIKASELSNNRTTFGFRFGVTKTELEQLEGETSFDAPLLAGRHQCPLSPRFMITRSRCSL